MAYKDSGEIATNSNYALGDYSFRVERSSVPGSTNDKIEAICTDKDGKNARKSIQIPSTYQYNSWYVEANEDTADVYALIRVPKGVSERTSDLDTGNVPQPIPSGGSFTFGWGVAVHHGVEYDPWYINTHSAYATLLFATVGQSYTYEINASVTPEDVVNNLSVNQIDGSSITSQGHVGNQPFIHNGKPVYYSIGGGSGTNIRSVSGPCLPYMIPNKVAEVAWTMVYGSSSGGEEYETKEILVGRFAIELEDAGGVGPGSDWIDPGDYDPDWKPDDPTHTLYVTVTGALSGRHNDPIEDPSYSYIPADKDTVKDYGCGGDGGHGGGGGAGASTVVVHKFATNQANSKEVTAIARRHGYGSGGGKGGKGGDGCILVYY